MTLTLTLLGTGTSAGVPMIGCTCDVCTSTDPRDRRDRAAAMLTWRPAPSPPATHHPPRAASGGATLLIDTAPDLRHQMLRHRVMRIDGVVYTHNHADHIFGIDDLRRFNAVQGAAIDIYAEPPVIESLRTTFTYIFEPHKNPQKSFIPTLIPHPIEPGRPFTVAGLDITPLRIHHGKLPIVGYRAGRIAYCTDCSRIPPETYPLLEDLDVLVIDALRYRHHPTHMTVDQALSVIDEVKPRRAYLTHIAHEIRHADLEARLPDHVQIAHDGLTIESE